MHTVLGLSLNADSVGWVLVDAAHGTVLDHDAVELHGGAETAGVAARNAQAIARACGFEVNRIRLTWTEDVADDALRLRTRLRHLVCGDVETVPMPCAAAVLVESEDTGITEQRAQLAPAYGAAMTAVGPGEPITVPAVQQVRAFSRFPHRRLASAALGCAAAAVLGLLCLSAGAAPQPGPPAKTAQETTARETMSADTGWATVPAPSDMSTNSVRKIVAVPSYAEESATPPAQSVVPARVATANAAESNPAPSTGLQHLSGAPPAVGPAPELADPASEPAPGPDMPGPAAGIEMTEILSALNALP